jgi:thiamine-monophosphate kinase
MRNETEIIERIWRALPTRTRKKGRDWLRLGVGDDAAVIRAAARGGTEAGDWVLSTDAFLEGVHFLSEVHSPGDIGYKALARATSDLAAMGAVPRFFLLTLALPASRTGGWLDGFLKGMGQAAREFGMVVIGGDTSRFPSVVINVTVGGQAVARQTGSGNGASKRASSGEAGTGRLLTRSGARPGDLIFVSGTLGAAQLGLELILHGLDGQSSTPRIPRGKRWKRLLQPHLRPKIQLALGRWLAGENSIGERNPSSDKNTSARTGRGPIASAMIDTSDGLSTDLNHICQSSGVGARIWAEKIPAVRVPESLRRHGLSLDPLNLALHGGEDYQLLFTVPPAAARRLPRPFRGIHLTQIGEIVRLPRSNRERASRIQLVGSDRNVSPLVPGGWDSFKGHSSR